MITTTHVLIGAAAASRPHFRPWQITLAWLGGFAPDISIFMMVALSRIVSVPGANIWHRPDGLYWQEPWQTFSAILNSVPLWAVIIIAGWLLFKNHQSYRSLGIGLLIVGVAALLHVVTDFLTHADDAHVHFWPITDWRFNSPVSYYQTAYYGQVFSIFETVLNIALALYLILRFRQWPVRVLAVLFVAPSVMVQVLAPYIF